MLQINSFIEKYIDIVSKKYECDKKELEELWKKVNRFSSTFTLTYGNRAENHKGMQIIGKKLDKGLSNENLYNIQHFFHRKGFDTTMIKLDEYLDSERSDKGEDALLLVVKNGTSHFVDVDELYREVDKTPKDTKALMYGRVVNKKARHNNCFSDFSQEARIEEGKGTVINFKDVPLINKIREELQTIIEVEGLQCEGNYYYDLEKTYIGFHGDTEREIVIGVRLGADYNIYYRWYKNNLPVGRLFKLNLQHGDIYFMSDKTTGNDWKYKNIYTLRHAASKYDKLIGI
jgi:hypothetical protein